MENGWNFERMEKDSRRAKAVAQEMNYSATHNPFGFRMMGSQQYKYKSVGNKVYMKKF